jgi:hypothetical protein
MINDEIGEAAGRVWQYLNTNGEASVTRISKDTGLEPKLCQRAIGWLAKEEKLSIRLQGRTELISLR